MNPFVMEVMDDAMSNVLRQKTEVERLRIAGRMWKLARVILRGGGNSGERTNQGVSPIRKRLEVTK